MNLREQLIFEEGRRRSAYPDSRGFLTIGVGRLIDKRKGGGLSEAEIDLLLDNDIRDKTTAVLKALPWAALLNEARQAVLIGMAFQMGLDGLLGFPRMLADVQAGKYALAAQEMRESVWFKQTPDRAERLAKQMYSGEFAT